MTRNRQTEMPLHELVAVGELPRLDAVELLDDGLICHPASGMLYRPASVSDHAVAEYRAGDRWVTLALPLAGQPRSLAQWEARRAESARVAAEQDEARRRRLTSTRVPVSLAWVEGRPLPTLAEAYRILLAEEALVEVDENGRLSIALSPWAGAINTFGSLSVLPTTEARLRDAVRVLYCAERTVVELLAAGQALPDVDVTPTGEPIR